MEEQSFYQVLKKRRSIRKFRKLEIDGTKLQKILEAYDSAPSAGGLQNLEIYVTKSSEMMDKLVKAALDQQYIAEAALVLVFCANPTRSALKYGERSKLFSIQL
ncbi:MAG: nitroreductase family protein [Candidatus Eiseniibacteriota bacterium]